MLRLSCKTPGWLDRTQEALRLSGVAIVEDAIPKDLLARTRPALHKALGAIRAEVGADRLTAAGELGIARLPMKYDPVFFRYLEILEILEIVDAVVSSTAILHLQNGFLLPPSSPAESTGAFQLKFHQDFPRVLNGYVASINILIAIDEFTTENGATMVVPATHQLSSTPSADFLAANEVPAEASAGSLLIFDSTLWHRAGPNRSAADRLAINQQFTRSYIKQQIDYVRALGDEAVTAQCARTQQLLGWYTRVVTSLDEYYRPAEARLYRRNQG